VGRPAEKELSLVAESIWLFAWNWAAARGGKRKTTTRGSQKIGVVTQLLRAKYESGKAGARMKSASGGWGTVPVSERVGRSLGEGDRTSFRGGGMVKKQKTCRKTSCKCITVFDSARENQEVDKKWTLHGYNKQDAGRLGASAPQGEGNGHSQKRTRAVAGENWTRESSGAKDTGPLNRCERARRDLFSVHLGPMIKNQLLRNLVAGEKLIR